MLESYKRLLVVKRFCLITFKLFSIGYVGLRGLCHKLFVARYESFMARHVFFVYPCTTKTVELCGIILV